MRSVNLPINANLIAIESIKYLYIITGVLYCTERRVLDAVEKEVEECIKELKEFKRKERK